MNVLVFEWGSYTHNDILDAFSRKGFNLKVIKHRFDDVNNDDGFVRSFDKELDKEQTQEN